MRIRNDSGARLPINDLGKSLDTGQVISLYSLPLDEVYPSSQPGGDINTAVGSGALVVLGDDNQPLAVPIGQALLEGGDLSPIELREVTTFNYIPTFYDPFRDKQLSVETRDLFYWMDTASTYVFAHPLGATRPLRTYYIPRDATIVESALYATNFQGPFYLYSSVVGGAYGFLFSDLSTNIQTDYTYLVDGNNVDIPAGSLLRIYLIPYQGGSLSTVEVHIKLRWRAT